MNEGSYSNVHLPSLRSVDSATICWFTKKIQGIYFSSSTYIIFQLSLIMRTALISGHSLPSPPQSCQLGSLVFPDAFPTAGMRKNGKQTVKILH